MAAGDFSGSTLLRLNVKLEEMFAMPNTSMTEYNEPAMSARALLASQRANADDRLIGEDCVGVRAWFQRTSAIGEVSASTDCTTPGGNESETVGTNYDSEILGHFAGTAKDSRCNNELSFIDESANVIRRLIAAQRKKLNTTIISRLAAGAQENIDANIDATWDATTDAPAILVPSADFTWDSLGEFLAVAANNKFEETLMLSGRNFYNDWWKANFERLNADGPAGFAAYQASGIFFDLRDLDTALGYKGTFAIDRNSYIFWNTMYSTPTPTQISETKWVWTVADPELSYVKNGVLTPVMYEIEMDKTCSARTTLGKLQFTYKFYLRLIGGFKLAPTGPNDETGVLLFKSA
jgi:hypothetical protein